MATIVQLPRLSDTMEEGVIAKWHIKPGDTVKRGQLIAEIETDKATMEFESFDAGTVLALVAAEGETLPIGATIAVLGKPGEDPEQALAGAVKGKAAAKSTGDGDDAAGEPEPTSDETAVVEPEQTPAAKPPAKKKKKKSFTQQKVTSDVSSPVTEVPDPETDGDDGDDDAEGSDAEGSDADADDADDEDDEDDEDALAATPDDRGDRIAASPLARRLAREKGLSLADIPGSGPRGRVVKTDVEMAAKTAAKAAARRSGASLAPKPAGDTVVVLSQMRKAIARRMAKANAEIPHFYLTIVIDMGRVAAMRDEIAAADIKVSYNDFVLMGCAKALRVHPEVNAFWNGETIVRRGDVHLGIAVALDEGLVVPVLRHADTLTLSTIAATARELGTRARAKTLEASALSGSTFSVSNLGMFGIEAFSAVVNPGEGAILAVGGIADEAVVVEGQLGIGKRMRVTLSCDHRVMDGAAGARFLATLQGMLEHPMRLLA